MANTSSILEEIYALITSNSVYNKSIETLESNSSLDQSIFHQLENDLSKLTIKYEELLSCQIDYLSPLLLFLLEHIPLEIDLNILTSTQMNSHTQLSTTKNIYKPKLSSSIQYSSKAQKLLDQLFQYLQITNFQEFLLLKQNCQPIYLHCLHLLTPLLLKTTYEKYPIAIEVFIQIIKSMNQSSLSETFDLIFPICLMTLDDPSIDMKLISLDLLDHLQRNSTTTDLLLFNRANVVMYGLEQNLHRRGDRVIFFECLLATTYRWLIILENEIYSGKHLFIRTSQLIERFIRDALLEINIEYRRLFLKILRNYINRLELFAIRHLNHLLELIDDSIDHRLLRYNSFEMLLTIIQILKPRINVHRYDIMKIIIRCLFKILHEENDQTSISNLLKNCLKELQLSTTENYVQDALKSLIETSQLDAIYRDYLQTFLDTMRED